jgi:hypothetical protein
VAGRSPSHRRRACRPDAAKSICFLQTHELEFIESLFIDAARVAVKLAKCFREKPNTRNRYQQQVARTGVVPQDADQTIARGRGCGARHEMRLPGGDIVACSAATVASPVDKLRFVAWIGARIWKRDAGVCIRLCCGYHVSGFMLVVMMAYPTSIFDDTDVCRLLAHVCTS